MKWICIFGFGLFSVVAFGQTAFEGQYAHAGGPLADLNIEKETPKVAATSTSSKPSKDFLFVQGPSGRTYELTTGSGNPVMKGTLNGPIDVRSLTPGVYVLKINEGDRQSVRILKL